MFYIQCFQTLMHSTNTWTFQQCIGICLFGSHIWKPSIHFFTSQVEFYFQFIHIESIPVSTIFMAATNLYIKGVKLNTPESQRKHVMKFFKGRGLILRCICLTPYNSGQYSNLDLLCSPTTRIPPGFLAIYVGYECKRFLIPTRFLNFPVFTVLLDKASEEYGFKFSGGIVLPCEVQFFTKLFKFLVKDEKKYRSLGFHEFFKLISHFWSGIWFNFMQRGRWLPESLSWAQTSTAES